MAVPVGTEPGTGVVAEPDVEVAAAAPPVDAAGVGVPEALLEHATELGRFVTPAEPQICFANLSVAVRSQVITSVTSVNQHFSKKSDSRTLLVRWRACILDATAYGVNERAGGADAFDIDDTARFRDRTQRAVFL